MCCMGVVPVDVMTAIWDVHGDVARHSLVFCHWYSFGYAPSRHGAQDRPPHACATDDVGVSSSGDKGVSLIR